MKPPVCYGDGMTALDFPAPMTGETRTRCLWDGPLGSLPVPPSPSRRNTYGLGGHTGGDLR